MEKVEEANEVVQKNQESNIITDFRAKTNAVFHDISEMNPTEIEETIKCHVQAKIDEYDIDATIIDAVWLLCMLPLGNKRCGRLLQMR